MLAGLAGLAGRRPPGADLAHLRRVGVEADGQLLQVAFPAINRLNRGFLYGAEPGALAEALSGMAGIESPGGTAQPVPGPLDPGRVATNFVLFKVDRDRAAFLDALRARNVLMVEYAHGQVRAVTHHDISADDIEWYLLARLAARGEPATLAPLPCGSRESNTTRSPASIRTRAGRRG